jgi:hypothetical protein
MVKQIPMQATQKGFGCGEKQLLIVGKSGIVQTGFELAIKRIGPTL